MQCTTVPASPFCCTDLPLHRLQGVHSPGVMTYTIVMSSSRSCGAIPAVMKNSKFSRCVKQESELRLLNKAGCLQTVYLGPHLYGILPTESSNVIFAL